MNKGNKKREKTEKGKRLKKKKESIEKKLSYDSSNKKILYLLVCVEV